MEGFLAPNGQKVFDNKMIFRQFSSSPTFISPRGDDATVARLILDRWLYLSCAYDVGAGRRHGSSESDTAHVSVDGHFSVPCTGAAARRVA